MGIAFCVIGILIAYGTLTWGSTYLTLLGMVIFVVGIFIMMDGYFYVEIIREVLIFLAGLNKK